MTYSYVEAAQLAQNPLTAGVFKAVCTTNELISRIMWEEVTGTVYSFSREGALADADFIGLDSAATVSESSSAGDNVMVPLRFISSDVDILNSMSNATTPNGDPRAFQLTQKLKAAGLKIQNKLVTGSNVTGFTVSESGSSPGAAVSAASPGPGIDTDLMGPASLKYTHATTTWQFRAPGEISYGDGVVIAADGSATLYAASTSKYVTITVTVASATADGEVALRFTSTNNEPDGINKLCPLSQSVDAGSGTDGTDLSLTHFDQLLIDMVKIREQRVFCLNSKLMLKYLALARTASVSETVAMQVFGSNGQLTTQQVVSYRGVPILQVDDIPNTESKGSASNLTSLYCASLAPRVGLHGVVQSVGSMQNVNLDPYQARIGGFKLYDLGQRETKPASGIRVEWYGGFAVGSPLAIGRLTQIKQA